jgi:hypothetical protein
MAKDLGLFGMQTDENDGPKVQHARLYTAWSAFCWQRYSISAVNPRLGHFALTCAKHASSLWCYHFLVPPLVEQPPPDPLPDPDDKPEWYGEIHMRYPAAERISPTGHGHLFKAKAEFLTILNGLSNRLSHSSAESGHMTSELNRVWSYAPRRFFYYYDWLWRCERVDVC